MKKIFVISLSVLIILICVSFILKRTKYRNYELVRILTNSNAKSSTSLGYKNLDSFILISKKYCKKEKFDTTIAIIINYQKHSGTKRGYIIDLRTQKIKDSFIVSHGCGVNNWGGDGSKNSPEFSNEFESHCSSLGKYKLLERAYSQWGINVKYVMYGLDKTNSNAYKRTIVLHGWENVSSEEIYPSGTPEGWGCPAVSNSTMTKLDDLLSPIKKPVLLWVF